jgi:hypothetical protein
MVIVKVDSGVGVNGIAVAVGTGEVVGGNGVGEIGVDAG